MDENAGEVANIPLRPDASVRVLYLSQRFGGHLTSQAKNLADYEGHTAVTTKHVDDAYDVLRGPRGPRREVPIASTLGTAFGGGLLGVGFENFVGEVSRAEGIRAVPVVASVVALVVGIVLIVVTSLSRR